MTVPPPAPAAPSAPGSGRPARAVDDRVVAGVAAGLGRWLGVDATVVRLAFVVLAVAGGWGVLVYLVAWAVLPESTAPTAATGSASPRPSAAHSPVRASGLGLVVLGLLLLLRRLELGFVDAVVWPTALVGLGLALTWDQVGARLGGPGGARIDVVRVVAGATVAVSGMAVLLGANLPARDVVTGLLAGGIVLGGLVLVFGPWVWRLARELSEERRARVRDAERAELAAHLHDSVLQTLALVQRRSDDPAEVARLARRQERELRDWLYGPGPGAATGSLGEAVEAAAAEVEDLHGVRVEVVVVGDRRLDETLAALVGAAREAMVNAAKFSGDPSVSVFVEVGPDGVEAYVRDRGRGFDPGRVGPGRRGIAQSIRGRMERVGGTVTIATAPGEGTEVSLRLPGAPS